MLEQFKCGRIQPLQIVEEQCEWVFLARKHAEEAPEDHLESILPILWWQLRDGWLRSDNELQLGNKVDDKPAVWAQRLPQRLAPRRKGRFGFAEQRPDQVLKGLCPRRVGNVALVL